MCSKIILNFSWLTFSAYCYINLFIYGDGASGIKNKYWYIDYYFCKNFKYINFTSRPFLETNPCLLSSEKMYWILYYNF